VGHVVHQVRREDAGSLLPEDLVRLSVQLEPFVRVERVPCLAEQFIELGAAVAEPVSLAGVEAVQREVRITGRSGVRLQVQLPVHRPEVLEARSTLLLQRLDLDADLGPGRDERLPERADVRATLAWPLHRGLEAVGIPGVLEELTGQRSEERRVGKEWRARLMACGSRV